jgi:predicted LPLAT superfamily acyltransferase
MARKIQALTVQIRKEHELFLMETDVLQTLLSEPSQVDTEVLIFARATLDRVSVHLGNLERMRVSLEKKQELYRRQRMVEVAFLRFMVIAIYVGILLLMWYVETLGSGS